MSSKDAVKELRDRTGISVAQCKSALEESGGDMEKALQLLRQQGASIAAKKGDRSLGAGTVAAYVHANKEVGAMVCLMTETDFVSKNEAFIRLAYDIAMHAAATSPENVESMLAEPYIKDTTMTVKQLIDTSVQKFGERIEVREVVRISSK